jgi:hypothetical protein
MLRANARLSRNEASFAALDRHRIDFTEQIEKNRLAVGRDTDRHPRALIGFEIDVAGFAASLRHVRFASRLLRIETKAGC